MLKLFCRRGQLNILSLARPYIKMIVINVYGLLDFCNSLFHICFIIALTIGMSLIVYKLDIEFY